MGFYLARLSIANIKQRRWQWTEWVTKLVERERQKTEDHTFHQKTHMASFGI
jgi:hypothetical protein